MKIVYLSRSKTGVPHPFVQEQADALARNYGLQIRHFLITQGGFKGCVQAIIGLYKLIRFEKIDIIHVHYGLWTLVAAITRWLAFKKYKIITTFHGSDLNKKTERPIALLGTRFAAHHILVSEKMQSYIKRNCSLLPCGIETDVPLCYREATRRTQNWGSNDFVVLFSSAFDRPVKDPGFATRVMEAFSQATTRSVKFIELKGYTRMQITQLMQAADALIMCSLTEGSPQVIKEAILNRLPIVSNDVGDVRSICAGVDHCFIVPKTVEQYVQCLCHLAGQYPRIQNRTPVMEKFDNNAIAQKLLGIYHQVLS